MDDIICMAAARDSLERYADSVNNYSNINSEYKKVYFSFWKICKKLLKFLLYLTC